MDASWDDFLHGRDHGRHGVRIYDDDAALASAVADYFAQGFAAGDPALVVATPEHRVVFAEALARRGWDAGRTSQHGLLVSADAAETLAAFTVDDAPSAELFDEVVGTLLDGVAAQLPGRRVRVFGEMVDLLAARGQHDAATRVENMWNGLAVRRDFSLLCAYRVDVFDRESQLRTLPAVCRTHSHVIPADDASRLARAVDAALAEVVGPEQTGRVYALAVTDAEAEHVPLSQLALMWTSRELPALSRRVLASARQHYLADPAAAANG